MLGYTSSLAPRTDISQSLLVSENSLVDFVLNSYVKELFPTPHSAAKSRITTIFLK